MSTFVTGTGVDADPGSLGLLLLVVGAAQQDATHFGGVDLVTRLGGTLGAFEPGLYGSYASVGDPTYSGVYDQSLSILGLAAGRRHRGRPRHSTWLADQQCGGSDEFTGAWMSYRAPATPPASGLSRAPPFDSTTFTGIDTNSAPRSAFEALVAAGRTPTHDALAWLARTQNSDGSFGFFVDNDGDPDSTALVIQAIVAGGESPGAGPAGSRASEPPLKRAWCRYQLGCDAAAADQGALTFPGTGGAPNLPGHRAGHVGDCAEAAFPLGAVTWSRPSPVPCQPTTTTTTPASSSTTATTTPRPPGHHECGARPSRADHAGEAATPTLRRLRCDPEKYIASR